MNFAYVVYVCVVAAMGGLLFGYDTAVISGAVEPLREHFRLDSLELGWVVGSALLGCVAGAAFAGRLTDLVGRRVVLTGSALLFLMSALWCYVSTAVSELVSARVLGGVAVGFSSLLVPIYIAELAPPARRGALVSINQGAILVGMVLSYLANAWIGRMGGWNWLAERGWRLMLGADAVPALLFLILSFFIPESPRWLLKQGRTAAAYRVLDRLHGFMAAKAELTEIQSAISREEGAVAELFGTGHRGVLVMAMALALFQAITGINIVMYYAPTIFTSAGVGTGDALGHSVIIGLVMLSFTILSMFLVDRVGRRPLMLLASVGMGASLCLLGVMFAGAAGGSRWLLLWTLTYVSSFSIGMGGVYWVVVSEIFPTRVRGVAVSLSVVFLWGGNYLVSQFFPIMLATLEGNVFYLFALMCVLCFLFILTFVPETRGRTLETIEAELYGNRKSAAQSAAALSVGPEHRK
jgi:sugar porter (SP) family MFS transporter